MATARIPETVRRVFAENFTARDVAEPLASFDAETSSAMVREHVQVRTLEVVGVRKDGHIAGYVEVRSLESGPCGQFLRLFDDAFVMKETAPLLEVILKLNESPHVFIRVLGQVGGVITRADLQKPPMRMWLFGIVTMIEMRFAELIERHCPDNAWRHYLSEARLQKADALFDAHSRRNEKVQLFDCLQFSDKGKIVACNEDIRRRTVFSSRSQAEATVKKLEKLRNNLAHAQDIVATNWDTIMDLCRFFQSSATEG
jgi:hypothetical protein